MKLGHLDIAKDTPYTARNKFETALTHFPDHPVAIVGLSNILLDIYGQTLLPRPPIPSVGAAESNSDPSALDSLSKPPSPPSLPSEPLGLGSIKPKRSVSRGRDRDKGAGTDVDEQLPVPYKATSLPLVDRLAARDRAYGLLSGLTKLGSGWNLSEAWFALARAYEESGQPEKAKEVLWWCVELEEATGIRGWQCLGGGGYVI